MTSARIGKDALETLASRLAVPKQHRAAFVRGVAAAIKDYNERSAEIRDRGGGRRPSSIEGAIADLARHATQVLRAAAFDPTGPQVKPALDQLARRLSDCPPDALDALRRRVGVMSSRLPDAETILRGMDGTAREYLEALDRVGILSGVTAWSRPIR